MDDSQYAPEDTIAERRRQLLAHGFHHLRTGKMSVSEWESDPLVLLLAQAAGVPQKQLEHWAFFARYFRKDDSF